MKINDIIQLLVCPDCGAELKKNSDDIQCISCGRVFEILHNNCINLLPSKKFIRTGKTEVEKRSIEIYNKLFDEPFTWKENPLPWGLNISVNYQKKLHKHKYMVYKLIPESIECFCDISAGSGRFSWEIAKKSKLSILCDISVDSAVYLSKKIINEGLNNIFVIRCDYLQPPFKENIFDVVLCNDTLIYGYEHEIRLLLSIYSILKSKDGQTILDFSYKYHRGLWHKPYTFAYSKKNMIKMLQSVKFQIQDIIPLYYEFNKDLDEKRFMTKILKYLLPPTRYLFKCVKG